MSITLNRKTYTVAGELADGFFYLEGPKGGDVQIAKHANDGIYTFHSLSGGRIMKDGQGNLLTATREELSA